MSVFQYRRLSSKLLEEMTETVLDGKSVVVLALRYGGKSYIMTSLKARLEQAGIESIITFRLEDKSLLMTEVEVRDKIREAVAAVAPPHFRPRMEPEEDILAPIEQLSDHLNRPVVLLAAHLDG